jgi:uncharacterized circularly permuted ATP-grasp superfamily protein
VEASPSFAIHDTGVYDPGDHWDEAFAAPGEPRPHYRDVLDALANADLARLQRTISLAGAMRGMAFRGSRGPQAFPLDPVPRILPADEHVLLDSGLAQRARALDAFLTDVYTDGRIVAAGVVPDRVLGSSGVVEEDVRAIACAQDGIRAGVAGFDIVRDRAGELRVLEDNLRVPSGAAYMTEARAILDERRVLEAPDGRSPLDVGAFLWTALRDAAPPGTDVDDLSAAVLSDGPANSAWWEHRRLARALGVPVVTPRDVVQRDGRVHICARGTDGLRPIDVLYRRTDESRLRDSSGRLTWVGDLLLEPLKRGTVGCINGFGTAIADDKLVHAYVEEMIRFYLGEEPVVCSVATHDPGELAIRRDVLERIDEMVVKPRNGSGGAGVIVCPHATREDRERAARVVRDQPEAYVVQETIALSTHPTVIGQTLEPRHIDLRAFAYGGRVLPGGLTRVALDAGALVVNSSMNGGGKDTWMLS